MSTYTVIWEYKRGTYIKQVRARSALDALVTWSQALSCGEIPGIGEKRLTRMAHAFANDTAGVLQPVPLEGLTNAWCASTPFGGLVNIIKTDLAR